MNYTIVPGKELLIVWIATNCATLTRASVVHTRPYIASPYSVGMHIYCTAKDSGHTTHIATCGTRGLPRPVKLNYAYDTMETPLRCHLYTNFTLAGSISFTCYPSLKEYLYFIVLRCTLLP